MKILSTNEAKTLIFNPPPSRITATIKDSVFHYYPSAIHRLDLWRISRTALAAILTFATFGMALCFSQTVKNWWKGKEVTDMWFPENSNTERTENLENLLRLCLQVNQGKLAEHEQQIILELDQDPNFIINIIHEETIDWVIDYCLSNKIASYLLISVLATKQFRELSFEAQNKGHEALHQTATNRFNQGFS